MESKNIWTIIAAVMIVTGICIGGVAYVVLNEHTTVAPPSHNGNNNTTATHNSFKLNLQIESFGSYQQGASPAIGSNSNGLIPTNVFMPSLYLNANGTLNPNGSGGIIFQYDLVTNHVASVNLTIHKGIVNEVLENFNFNGTMFNNTLSNLTSPHKTTLFLINHEGVINATVSVHALNVTKNESVNIFSLPMSNIYVNPANVTTNVNETFNVSIGKIAYANSTFVVTWGNFSYGTFNYDLNYSWYVVDQFIPYAPTLYTLQQINATYLGSTPTITHEFTSAGNYTIAVILTYGTFQYSLAVPMQGIS